MKNSHLALIHALMRNEADLMAAKNRFRDQNTILGEALRQARIESGLSLREVARRTKKSAPFVSDIERGRRTLTPRFLTHYLSVLQ